MNTLTQLNKKHPFVACMSNQLSSIVILDPTVPESNYIAQGLKPDTEIYILENQPDAVEQIATFLAQHTGIESLHIITHGSPGKIYLGTTELNSSNSQAQTSPPTPNLQVTAIEVAPGTSPNSSPHPAKCPNWRS